MAASRFVLLILAVYFCPGSSRLIIDPVSIMSQKSLTAGICSECSQIIQLSTNMISSSDTKETVYKVLHAACHHLPKEEAQRCEAQVKLYLPKVLQQASSNLKPQEVCEAFGLCALGKKEKQKLLHSGTGEVESSSALRSETKEQFSPVCTLCLFVIKKLETLLPQNMTEDTLKKLMGDVCDLMPKSYKDQCDDFIDKYGVEIVEFLLSSAAPHTICTLLHLCFFNEQPVPEVTVPSDCESCRSLAVLSRLYLGLNASESQTSAFLHSVCELHPHAIPKCDAFTRVYGSQLQKVLGNQMDVPHVCEKADLCIVSKKAELLGKNHCTWGPSYWCKNLKTAQKCGNQAFCEKHVWRKNV